MAQDQSSLAWRVRFARTQRQLTQANLAEASGLKQPDISKIERGLIVQTTGIARLARALRVPSLWLETGEGATPQFESAPPMLTRRENLTDHGLSHLPVIMQEHRYTTDQVRELILEGEPLKERFMTQMPDASGGERYPKGHWIIWSTRRAPVIGKPVLFMDAHNRLLARQYREGTEPGHWIAAPLNPAFSTLDSVEHKLTIVAVYLGEMDADDENGDVRLLGYSGVLGRRSRPGDA